MLSGAESESTQAVFGRVVVLVDPPLEDLPFLERQRGLEGKDGPVFDTGSCGDRPAPLVVVLSVDGRCSREGRLIEVGESFDQLDFSHFSRFIRSPCEEFDFGDDEVPVRGQSRTLGGQVWGRKGFETYCSDGTLIDHGIDGVEALIGPTGGPDGAIGLGC